ncbi:hypothetical protein MMC25_001683 [Agyrium rufum]|nr:hypothetical protein [Agyrium rufum]
MVLYEEQFATYGKTWEENFLGTTVINTMHSENIQQVATFLFDDFTRNAGSRNVGWPFIGKGITTMDGADWKHSRGIVKPIFARSELSDIEGLGVFVDRLIEMIPTDDRTFDIQPLLHKMFLDVSTEFIFGKSMNSLYPNTTFNSDEFFAAFDEALGGVGKRRLAGAWDRLLLIFDQPWRKAYQKIHAYVDERVKDALDATKVATKGKRSLDSQSGSQPRKYILIDEMAKEIRDPIELRYQTLTVFLPARDTLSILVGNTLFYLARSPQVWTKLCEQALEIDPNTITFESLKSLTDFRNVLWETMRIQGPSGRVIRFAKRDVVLPRGGGEDGESPILVKKGTSVHLNPYCMHHDADIWGPDVHEFKPKRFVGKRLSWEFIPFYGGPRICPANQQVLTHATYTLLRLTRQFRRIENRDPVMEYLELRKMTAQSKNGVQIAFT